MAHACEACRVRHQHLREVLLETLSDVADWPPQLNDALSRMFDVEALATTMAKCIEPAIETLWMASSATLLTKETE